MPKSNHLPPMSLNSAASSSSLYSSSSMGTTATTATTTTATSGFPAMPPSPATTAAPEHICFLPTLTTAEAATSTVQKCLSPAAYSSTRCSSRVNLQGSWLDLESDTECDNDTYSLMRMRRKSSGASSKGSGGSINGGRSVLAANLKELTRRSSMHLRKLTAKMGSSSAS
ncbi:hypothetical protein IWW47_002691 [Coemansia sp. RSA 2052]|nr:hypothetical protein IWW47_002691 [Coemansia sp. RSA 2052]